MEKIRIVGVGSPFGADQLGWQAAEYLAEELERRAPGCVLSCDVLDRPGALLLDYLKPWEGLKPGEGVVLLIDAVAAAPGLPAVACYDREALAAQEGISSHGFGVADALALGERLGLLHERIYLLGITEGGGAWQEALLGEVEKLLTPESAVFPISPA